MAYAPYYAELSAEGVEPVRFHGSGTLDALGLTAVVGYYTEPVNLYWSTGNHVFGQYLDAGLARDDTTYIDMLSDVLLIIRSLGHLAYRGNHVVLLSEVNQSDTLRRAAHNAHLIDIQSEQDATLVDNHEVVLVGDHLNGYEAACLLRDSHRLDALASAVGDTIVLNVRTLAIAILRDDHDGLRLRIVDADHAHDLVVAVVETHADDACRDASHGANLLFVESDGPPVSVGQDEFVVSVGESDADDAVALEDIDSVDAVGPGPAVGLEAGLLDDAVLRGEHNIVGVEKFLVVELLDAEHGIDLIVGLNVQEVLDGTTFRVLVAFRNLVALLPIAASLLCEEEQRVMHRGRIDILCEVVVAMTRSFGADAATSLGVEFGQRRALDVAQVGYGDDNAINKAFRVSAMKMKAAMIESFGTCIKEPKTPLSEVIYIRVNDHVDQNAFSQNRRLRDNIHYKYHNDFSPEELDLIDRFQRKYFQIVFMSFDEQLKIRIDRKYKAVMWIADHTDTERRKARGQMRRDKRTKVQ